MSLLLEDKVGLILGVANQSSLAWGIAERCHREGARLAFTYLNETLGRRVIPLAEQLGSEHVIQCDVLNERELDTAFQTIASTYGRIDFIVHAIAFAQSEDLRNRFIDTSRAGFLLALEVSVYSLIAVARRALPLLKPGGSLLTLSYLGSQKVVPNYRVMGVAKAALEASVRELAVDLGQENVRVNAISAGPIRTLAASGISDFRELLTCFESRAPLHRLVTIEDVGAAATYLLSDLSAAVTGEVHYVDAGFNVTAM